MNTSAPPLAYPKEKIGFFLAENVHSAAVKVLQESGYTRLHTQAGALQMDLLPPEWAQTYVVGLRSKTQLTAGLMAAAPRLMAIGVFGIGTDQVNLTTATQLGIPVFNSPFSSTRSVAELVVGACVMLLRQVLPKHAAAHAGVWLKQAEGARELRGKTLGIVGYGRIGSQVSVLAEALGMRVLYHDLVPRLGLGNAHAAENLHALLAQADVVTLHVPDDATTLNLLDRPQLAAMKRGAMLINYARGRVVNLGALADALKEGHLAGAALDVFPEEPATNQQPFVTPVQGLPNVLLTPHIGGSTEEAQQNIGTDVAQKLVAFLDQGITYGAVNVPELSLPPQEGVHRMLHFHQNQPGVLKGINGCLAECGFNITGQYLKTNEQLGYVVVDVTPTTSAQQTTHAVNCLRQLPGTLRVRAIY